MILPQTGSVVIIDDQPSEAMPIISTLSKNGIACTYFKGYKQDELPNEPLKPVRLVILDLQLFDGVTDPHIIATNLIQVLKRLISERNGPYLLLLWSKKENLYADTLKQAVNNPANNVVPAFIVSLPKLDCIEQEEAASNEKQAITEIVDELKAAFDDDDMAVIRKTLETKLQPKEDIIYKARANAIDIIENKIKEEIQKAGVFHLFVIWENLAKKAAADTVYSISSPIPMNELWESNMKDIIKRMAKARTGLNVINDRQALTESLTIFNNSFVDDLESKIKQFQFPEYLNLSTPFLIAERNNNGLFGLKEIVMPGTGEIRVLINRDGVDSQNSVTRRNIANLPAGLSEPEQSAAARLTAIYGEIPFAINTSLHLEVHTTNELVPGNVYKISVSDASKQTYLLTYFDKIEAPLDEYQFIELEVSPICDYAQTKWKKSRLISGVIYPIRCRGKSNTDHLYNVDPIIIFDGKPSKIIFDFHLFKAVDKEVMQQKEIAFRIKKELLMDIIVKLSSHVNRAGISFVS